MTEPATAEATPLAPETGETTPTVDPDPLAPDADAPYGYTVDRATGQRRAKKVPGRPVKTGDGGGSVPTYGTSPPIEDLKAGTGKSADDEDRAPGKPPRGLRRARHEHAPKEEPEVTPFRAGPIAKGMNKLYAKAGKIIKVMDPEIGNAILSVTRKESDDDVTVGEAWEEIARTNPRIRMFLLKMIAGGAWTQLLMAHAPILLAVVMKDQVRKHIPFMRLVSALLEDDEDGTPSDISEAFGGLTPDDAEQMANFAQTMAAQMGMGGLDMGRLITGLNVGRRVVPGNVERPGTAGG